MTENAVTDAKRVALAIGIIETYGGYDGAHHKQWVLDQVMRVLHPDYNDEAHRLAAVLASPSETTGYAIFNGGDNGTN